METREIRDTQSNGSYIDSFAAMNQSMALKPYRYSPKELGPMDVEIDISHCGMCHTDLHLIKNDVGISTYPLVPGHEIVGSITQMGSEVTAHTIGSRVGVGWLAGADFTCEQCTSGRDNLCYNGQPTCLGREGGYATRIRVDSRFAFSIPEKLTSEHAAPLLCAGITVFAPMLRHGVSGGTRLGVIGIGGLGHLAIQYGHALGSHVTAFSTSVDKEKAAKQFGADDFVDSSRENTLERYENSCDFIICTATADLSWGAYINALRPNGKFCIVGVPDSELQINALQLIFGQKSVISSIIGSRSEMQIMLDFSARHGIVPLIELFPMSEVNTALDKLKKNKVRYRAVLQNN